jgi:fatty acid-binding protein DegV
MKKPVCFLYDSSSSIKEGEFPDTYVLPLMVQDCTSSKQYFDGVNITTSKIERALIKGHQFKTSSSQPDDVLKILTKLSKKYETIYVFLIPMTLSPGQNNTVTLISKEFDNVIIVPHYMVTLMAK